MESFGKLMTIILGIIFSTVVNGFVFAKLWLWFIVPTLHTQPLRVVEAIGISFLIGFVFFKNSESKEDFWEAFVESLVLVVVKAIIGLGIGGLITLFL